MSDDNDGTDNDPFLRVMLTDPRIARLTPEIIGEALKGFALPSLKETAWIARALQAAVMVGMISNDGEPDRKGNAEIRDELAAFAKRASDLWLDLFTRSAQVDSALWSFAFESWRGDAEIDEASLMGHTAQLKAFADAVQALELLPAILGGAANHIGSRTQSAGWRAAQRFRQRIDLATCISPVFEEAFGRTATPLNGERPYGHWGDFFQRIMAAAFNERATPNLETVLKEARRRSLKSPVLFEPGIMPD